MRDAFLKQLEELHRMLAEMGSLCEDMIDGTYEALMNMDRDQAAKILAADANVDLKERDIESKCLKLLLEQQPVASDLRTISSTLKMITDLERIGDQAGDIAEIIKTTDLLQPVKVTRLGEMAKAVASMVRESIESFANADLKKTKEVIATVYYPASEPHSFLIKEDTLFTFGNSADLAAEFANGDGAEGKGISLASARQEMGLSN